MNIDAETRRRLHLPPRDHHELYNHAAFYLGGFATGLLWVAVYLWRVGAL